MKLENDKVTKIEAKDKVIKVNPIENWPKELLPEPRNKMVITVEINIKPPEDWNRTSGAIMLINAVAESSKFSFKIHEIIAISPTVKEDVTCPGIMDMNYAPDLDVGDWVVVVQAQDFVHLAQKFSMCAPQFIGVRIKKADADWRKTVDTWYNLLQEGEVVQGKFPEAPKEQGTPSPYNM